MNTRNMPLAARPRIRTKTHANRWTLSTFAGDAITFAIALTTSFSVTLVGSLPVSEIILLLLLPILLVFRGRRPVPSTLKMIYILMAFWLLGQILSDLYRQTPTLDWMRGDAAIIFFTLDITGLFLLISGNDRRKVLFITGLAFGSFLVTRFAPSRSAQGEPWKFGYASGTIMLVVLISCLFYRYHRYLIVAFLFAGIICVNLLENYRGPVLGLLVTMVLVVPLIPERVGRLRLLPRRGGVLRVAVLMGMAMGASWTASFLVHQATSAGFVSQEAQAKNQEQSSGKGGILLGGRPEIQVSSRAVMDSPIIGHGSWAKDYKYQEMLNDLLVERGQRSDLVSAEEEFEGLIPTHSHLMGAWVWAGILGAVFWVFFFWQVILAIVRVTTLRPALAPIYAFILQASMWDILFSPFGANLRIQDTLVLLIVLDLLPVKRVVVTSRRGRYSGRIAQSRFANLRGFPAPLA